MEVLSGGFWGPVCSFWWGLHVQNANVVCRQLGYDGALAVSSYEEQNSVTCLDVQCIGNESSILRCRSNGWEFGSLVTSVLCSPTGISFACSHFLSCTSPLSTLRRRCAWPVLLYELLKLPVTLVNSFHRKVIFFNQKSENNVIHGKLPF